MRKRTDDETVTPWGAAESRSEGQPGRLWVSVRARVVSTSSLPDDVFVKLLAIQGNRKGAGNVKIQDVWSGLEA